VLLVNGQPQLLVVKNNRLSLVVAGGYFFVKVPQERQRAIMLHLLRSWASPHSGAMLTAYRLVVPKILYRTYCNVDNA